MVFNFGGNDPNKQDTKNFSKNATMGEILGLSQQDKEEFSNQIKQELNKQQSSEKRQENEQQKGISGVQMQQKSNFQELQTKQENQSIVKDGEIKNDKYLYQELAKKYGIDMDAIDSNIQQKKMTFSQFSEQKQREKDAQERQIMMQEPISEAQQLAISKRVAKRRHISSYKKPQEVDIYMQSSFLDVQDEEKPDTMRYMDKYHTFTPEMNIGKKASDMIKTSATSQMKYEMAMQKGKGFLWHAAKTGKLGVDLYLCAFGIFGIIFIPYYFFRKQQLRMEWWKKERGIDRNKVDDFEDAGYDLDELSIEGTFENMFTKEIQEEKKRKIDIHSEIKFLVDSLLPNK